MNTELNTTTVEETIPFDLPAEVVEEVVVKVSPGEILQVVQTEDETGENDPVVVQ